jgi:hypothetical protein
VEINLQAFLTSVPDKGKWSQSGRFTLGEISLVAIAMWSQEQAEIEMSASVGNRNPGSIPYHIH